MHSLRVETYFAEGQGQIDLRPPVDETSVPSSYDLENVIHDLKEEGELRIDGLSSIGHGIDERGEYPMLVFDSTHPEKFNDDAASVVAAISRLGIEASMHPKECNRLRQQGARPPARPERFRGFLAGIITRH